MKLFFGFIVGLLALTVFWMWYNSEQSIKVKRVVAIGDSLVEGVGSESGGGFTSMLSKDLDVPITNLGRSGDTTEDVLKRMSDLDQYEPDVVILLAGGNDFLRGLPSERIFANLGKIIDEIEKRGAEVLLLGLENNLPGRKYGDYYEELVEEKEVAFVSDIMGKFFGNREFMYDGIHPNDKGYRIMADEVRESLEQVLK